jgi:hypothetical protein
MMSQTALLAHQIVLGRQLGAGDLGMASLADEPLPEAALDAQHRAQLTELVNSADFAFTRYVRQSWCAGRTIALARLTLSILPENAGRQLIDDWVARGGGGSLDPMSEAEEFFEFAAARLDNPSHALTICRMEQATLRASDAALTFAAPDLSLVDTARTVVARGRGAALVQLFATPESLLACISAREPLPPLAQPGLAVLFAPGITQLCRPASAEEAGVWGRLDAAATVATLLQEGCPHRLIRTMLDVGALDLRLFQPDLTAQSVDI